MAERHQRSKKRKGLPGEQLLGKRPEHRQIDRRNQNWQFCDLNFIRKPEQRVFTGKIWQLLTAAVRATIYGKEPC
jgi:hypothetical protein